MDKSMNDMGMKGGLESAMKPSAGKGAAASLAELARSGSSKFTHNSHEGEPKPADVGALKK